MNGVMNGEKYTTRSGKWERIWENGSAQSGICALGKGERGVLGELKGSLNRTYGPVYQDNSH